MRRLLHLASAFLAGVLATSSLAAQPATDHLGLPGPISFAGADYHLAWSSRPTDHYIKQEYLPPGQVAQRYHSMVLIEVLSGAVTPATAAAAQMAMLNDRRDSDPLVNMEMIQNPATGEYLLDFLVSARDEAGEIVVEWNGYRYGTALDGQGNPATILFAISHRAYGAAAAQSFLEGLRAFKAAQIATLAAMPMPVP